MIIGPPPPSPRSSDQLSARLVDARASGLVEALAASSDHWAVAYARNVLTCNAAIVVATNTWHSTGASHGTGSLTTLTRPAATATGGRLGECASRIEAYDPNPQLLLRPPWFPSIDDTYTTALSREVAR